MVQPQQVPPLTVEHMSSLLHLPGTGVGMGVGAGVGFGVGFGKHFESHLPVLAS